MDATPGAKATLARGYAGLAVAFSYMSSAGLASKGTSEEFLDRAMDLVSAEPLPPSLHGGFTGVAWAAEHLGRRDFTFEDDPNTEIDQALLEYIQSDSWDGDYDLVGGLAGFAVHAAERLPNTSGADILAAVTKRLAEIAEEDDEGITWPTAPDLLPDSAHESRAAGVYNLGASHGVPGAIAALVIAQANGVGAARELVGPAIKWLLGQRRDYAGGFPSYAGDSRPARTAWCYGGPGVALVLSSCAELLGDAPLLDAAVSIAEGAVSRPRESTGVSDFGLCHGAAGLAHIYNRIAQRSGSDHLRSAAISWSNEVIAQPAAGRFGYQAYLPAATDNGWLDDPGLLMGASGIALALTAAITPEVPGWDRVLLGSMVTSGVDRDA